MNQKYLFTLDLGQVAAEKIEMFAGRLCSFIGRKYHASANQNTENTEVALEFFISRQITHAALLLYISIFIILNIS